MTTSPPSATAAFSRFYEGLEELSQINTELLRRGEPLGRHVGAGPDLDVEQRVEALLTLIFPHGRDWEGSTVVQQDIARSVSAHDREGAVSDLCLISHAGMELLGRLDAQHDLVRGALRVQPTVAEFIEPLCGRGDRFMYGAGALFALFHSTAQTCGQDGHYSDFHHPVFSHRHYEN